MTHKFLAKNSRLPKYPPCPLLRCYERTPADRRVSTAFRRFAIPGPITRLPGFRKAPRFILSLLLSSFLPSFANLVLLPFNSYGATLSPPLMNRWREREKGWWNRENLNFALCPATFSLFLLLARAGFLFLFFCFFPPSLPFLFLFASPPFPPPSAQISRHNRRSEPKLLILEINSIIIITSLLFLLSETMRNRERGEGERGGSDIYYIRKIGNWSREFDE